MNPRITACVLGAACLASALATVPAAAHNWGCWIQPNRTVPAYVTAALSSQANAAVSEWDTKTILSVPRVGSHTEISVFDGYYGNTGWAGLASIENYSGCNILHGHARVNRSYSYTSNGYRGIFCQEVGHLFGLDHSNDGGCMGGGYFYSINTYYTVVQHNINDIATKYANSPPAAEEGPVDEGLAVPAAFGGEIPAGQSRAVAFWHDRPATLEEAMDRSQAVVVGRIAEIRAGSDIVVGVKGLPGDVDRIPTQRILVAVERVLAGKMTSKVFELFRTGNEVFTLAEDPAYAVGERYVLFLTRKEGTTFRIISPEGRLLIGDGGLVPSSEREFMSDLRGRSVDALGTDLARLSPVLGAEGGAPALARLQLRSNAAHPSHGETSLSYALPEAADVKLRIYDAQGRLVRSLVDARQEGQRWFTVAWDGRDDRGGAIAKGVFFARLETSIGVRSISLVRLD